MTTVEDMNGVTTEIERPSCRGHVCPGHKAFARGFDMTQRGYSGGGGYGYYYDAWYEVSGKLFFPIGDEFKHR